MSAVEQATNGHAASEQVHTRPRFPPHWIQEPKVEQGIQAPAGPPVPGPGRRLLPVVWGLLALMGLGSGVALYAMWQAYQAGATREAAHPQMFWIDGVIHDMSRNEAGNCLVTVIDVGGRPVTVAMDFGNTSVFQANGVLSIAHLKLGQQVRLVHERRLARSIEIVRQPLP